MQMINFKMKNAAESLWRETFGDSSAYISLVFDNYFDPELSAFHEENGELKSFLLGVPYTFESGNGSRLKGLYLCGVATRPESRKRGMMTRLLDDINRRAEEMEFDFTFLIPSGEGIRKYYKDRGYEDSFYKKTDRYVRGHKFHRRENVEIREYKTEDLEQTLEFLKSQKEHDRDKLHFQLIHSAKDWEIVLQEALISSEPVFLAIEDGKIRGVTFVRYHIEQDFKGEAPRKTEVEVKKLIAEDEEIEVNLLGYIMEQNPEIPLNVFRDLGEVAETADERKQVWSPFFPQSNNADAEYEEMSKVEVEYHPFSDAHPKGMIRIFNIRELLSKTGVENPDPTGEFTDEELIKTILRKPAIHKNDEIEKLLDIPEIVFSMALLLE